MSETRQRWRDDYRHIAEKNIQNPDASNEWIQVQSVFLVALLNDADRLAELERIGHRVINSGILCDPGCCGDDCGCDELRKALEK